MNKLFLFGLVFCISLFLVGCSSRPSYVPIYLSDNGVSNGSTVYVNTTNNITNNITNNVTNNITNNLSMLINGSVQCGGTDKLSNVTILSNVLSGICSADVSGGSSPLYSGSFTYNSILEDDQCGVLTTTGDGWYWTAIASGTTAIGTGYVTHPCVRRISSSATASSGGAFNIGGTNLLLAGNESSEFIFSKITKTGNNSNIILGFQDSVSATASVDLVGIVITNTSASNNHTLMGRVRTNNVETNTTLNFNITQDVWYRVRIEVFNTTQARFYLYNSTTITGTGTPTLLWNSTINVLLPTATGRQTGHGITTWVSGSTTAVGLVDIDYMNLMINRTIVR